MATPARPGKRPREEKGEGEREGGGSSLAAMSPPSKQSRRAPPKTPFRRGPKSVTRVRKEFHDPRPTVLSVVQSLLPNKYEHRPLADPKDDIRILVLLPGRPEDKLSCTFDYVSLADAASSKPYEALSYYWGTDQPNCEIKIQDVMEAKGKGKFKNIIKSIAEPKTFYIRSNLDAALKQFRQPDAHVSLWVDALCINQDDQVEKTHQVQKMSQIYSTANHVLIWLGAGDPRCEEALEFIDDAVDFATFDSLATNKESAPRWNSLMELMRCRWFSRRWVVQELAMAQDATVHYGHKEINWKDFADAIAAFATRFDDIKMLFRSSGRFRHEADSLGDIAGLGANTLVDTTNNLFRKSVRSEYFQGKSIRSRERNDRYPLLSLEALVAMLLSFEASDPKDTVYALLSIAKDRAHPDGPKLLDRLQPDYRKSVVEVYRDFIRYCVDTSGSLDIICRCWAPIERRSAVLNPARTSNKREEKPKLKVKMPSWVALLTKSPFGSPEQALNGRINGDSLVGHPDHKFYNACGGSVAKNAHFDNLDLDMSSPEPDPIPATTLLDGSASTYSESPSPTDINFQPDGLPVPAFFMHVEGFQIDVIQHVSARIADGLLLRECLTMGDWVEPYPYDDQNDNSVPDKLWRTLVAGKDPNGKNPPSWYHRACLQCFAYSTPSGDINTSSLINNPNTPSLVVSFLKRVQSVVWQRVFLKSKEQKLFQEHLFGLGPNEARAGDLICILYGCSVPVILREINDPKNFHYELIGESYIYGLMDGEALESLPAMGTTVFKLG